MYRIYGAFADAIPAVDAFPVGNLAYVHFAGTDTGVAMGALLLIHLHSEKGYGIEKGIDGSQRAKETAKGTITEAAAKKDQEKQQCFPAKEPSCHLTQTFIRDQ